MNAFLLVFLSFAISTVAFSQKSILLYSDSIPNSTGYKIVEEPVKYGLTKPVANANHPMKIIFHEWQNISKDIRKKLPLITRLKYLFMPPGWSPHGPGRTTEAMRAEAACAAAAAHAPSKAAAAAADQSAIARYAQ